MCLQNEAVETEEETHYTKDDLKKCGEEGDNEGWATRCEEVGGRVCGHETDCTFIDDQEGPDYEEGACFEQGIFAVDAMFWSILGHWSGLDVVCTAVWVHLGERDAYVNVKLEKISARRVQIPVVGRGRWLNIEIAVAFL